MIDMVAADGTPYAVDSELEAEMEVLRGSHRAPQPTHTPRPSPTGGGESPDSNS